MKMHWPATSDTAHATIAACVDFGGMSDDEIHDVLNGYVDIPTDPEPVRLRLSKVERADRWHAIAKRQLSQVGEGGDEMAVARGERAVAWTRAMLAYETLSEKLGDLSDGRYLGYVDHEALMGRFRVIDSVGTVVARVTIRDNPDTILRLVETYDAGVEAGRADARAAMRTALGI